MIAPGRAKAVPSQETPGGGTRRYVVEGELISNGESGGYNSNVARLVMSIPSVRLVPSISICFRPNAGEDTDFPGSGATAWLLTLDAWKRRDNGMWVRSNNIITNLPIPTTYEVTGGTTVDQWRGKVVVPASTEGSGTGIVPGTLFAIANWEPVQGDNISEKELSKLFQACNLSVQSISTTENGGS